MPEPTSLDLSKLTRIEIIDQEGRVAGVWDTNLVLSIQDGGRTLKAFTTDKAWTIPRPRKENHYD